MTMIRKATVVVAAVLLASHCASAQPAPLVGSKTVAARIRSEATRPNRGPAGRPLPLACAWHCGHYGHPTCAGWRPANQMRLVEDGHRLLPWFAHPPTTSEVPEDPDDFWVKYYEQPIRKAHALKLPITFVASQWESVLSGKRYVDLTAAENPNVVDVDGKVLKQASPFGPTAPWLEAGKAWTDNPWMKRLQELYPAPPLVIFLSNNEQRKLTWPKVETSNRYMQKYGKGRDSEFKRKVVADGWIERYRSLQKGMRGGLTSPSWKKNAIFVGYRAFGPEFIGRWGGWTKYSMHSAGRITPYPLMWDGGSPSYYTHDWNPSTDHTVWSPQLEFMNLLFMQEAAYKLNPEYRLEISVWDGYGGPRREKTRPSPRKLYRGKGQTYDPKRYAGFIQFGMWLVRPRTVREYRGWTCPWEGREAWEGAKPYFMALVEAVDRVHENATLTEWWRKGELVPNRAHPHHYQAGFPEEYKDEDRWFLLDADVNPQQRPWKLSEEISVYSLALVRGAAPARQWLIYAHAPVSARKDVTLTLPGYEAVTVDVSVGGSFWLVDEKSKSTTPVR